MTAIEPYRTALEPRGLADEPAYSHKPPQGDGIDFGGLFGAFRRHFRLFMIIFGVTLALVFVFLLVYPVRYTGTARVTIDARALTIVPDRETPVVSQLPPSPVDVDTEVQVIQSRRVAARVVDTLGLTQDPEFALQHPGLLGRSTRLILNFFAPISARSPHEEIIDAVLKNLDPERYLTTNAIDINFTDHDPVKAQRIANAFARAYLADQVATKLEQNLQATRDLLLQVNKMRREADEDSARVQKYKIAHNLMSVGALTLTEQEISVYNQGIATAKAEADGDVANLRTAEEQLARGSNGEDVGEALTSPVVGALRAQRAVVSAKLADLEGHYGPKYPDLAQARRQLADIDAEIQAEIRRTISNISAKSAVSQKRLASLQATLADTTGRLAQNNAAVVELENLTRAATVSQAIYEAYLDRYKESAAQAAAQTPDAHVVSYSDLPEQPSFPVLWLFLALGVVAGGLFGCAGVLLAAMTDNRLSSAEDVERLLNMPYLGGIPLLSSLSKTKGLAPIDAVDAEPLSAFSESFRSLRAAIAFAMPNPQPWVIAVTSSMPREGKTTVALGLARTSARQGVKTLLIDCDARRRGLTKALNIAATHPGLVEVLSGEAPLEAALVRDAPSGAWMLPMRFSDRSIDEWLGGEAMDRLVGRLRGEFQTILLDAAPLLPIAVTRFVCAKADATVLVSHWRKTGADGIRSALRLLPRDQIYVAGLVLSRIDLRRREAFGAGDAAGLFKTFKPYYD